MVASPQRIPTPREIDAELARRSLAYFIPLAWPTVEPSTDLVWGWHLDAIAEHLEAVVRGQIQDLIINVPPGHMKSLEACVLFPAWVWTWQPSWRALFGSYALDLALRDSVRCRDVITSKWYQETFLPDWGLKSAQNVKGAYQNDARGIRQCVSVGSGTTGFRGDAVVLDDPLSVMQAYSPAARDEASRYVKSALSSRFNDPRKRQRILIMQRLHEQDPTGVVLEDGNWVHLRLPSEFEPKLRCVTSIGWEDPRTEKGELLFPQFFTQQVIDQAKKDLGSDSYAGQHQQRPSPAGGGIFKKWWWRFWQPAGMNLPPVRVEGPDGVMVERPVVNLPKDFDQQLQSWDMTFKDTKGTDFVVGQVWAKKEANRYLLDQVRERLSFSHTIQAVRSLSERWPDADTRLVEDKANGPAVIDTLNDEISGLIAVNPEGAKRPAPTPCSLKWRQATCICRTRRSRPG